MKTCSLCENNLRKVNLIINKNKKVIRNFCDYCGTPFWESSDPKKLTWDYQENPDSETHHIDFKKVKKAEGLFSSAFGHYLVARNCLLNNLNIEGSIAASECMEKILKGLIVMEEVEERKSLFEKIKTLFIKEKNEMYGHVPLDLYIKYSSISKNPIHFNKSFLRFLQSVYRLRYKIEDERQQYSNSYRLWINNLKTLAELDNHVFNLIRKFTFNRDTPEYFRKTIWDLEYNSHNLLVAKNNVFLNIFQVRH